MKVFKLNSMVRGWFVGEFSPTAYTTPHCEVCCRFYRAGEQEKRHVHRIATELTLVQSGRVRMEGVEYGAGDIVVLEPGDPSDFEALDDTWTVVVKLPSVKGDKFQA
jgi:hypothetical protein